MIGRHAGRLVIESTEETVVDRLYVADTFWSRLCGLQFRKELPHGTGLLLCGCSAIHTFWMWFAIDVWFLDETGRVAEIRHRVCPWSLVAPRQPGVRFVLELPAESRDVSLGERLLLVPPAGEIFDGNCHKSLQPIPLIKVAR